VTVRREEKEDGDVQSQSDNGTDKQLWRVASKIIWFMASLFTWMVLKSAGNKNGSKMRD